MSSTSEDRNQWVGDRNSGGLIVGAGKRKQQDDEKDRERYICNGRQPLDPELPGPGADRSEALRSFGVCILLIPTGSP
jgi:hypothetical protein